MIRTMAAACLFLAASSAAGQQPAAKPEFEVAVIKPSDPAHPISIQHSGRRLITTSTSLEMLIAWAYNLEADRLFGQPGWLDNVRYDVTAEHEEAKLENGELYPMMQALLADRFKLQVHHETREFPVYALVVDDKGPKVHVAEPTEPTGASPFRKPGLGHLIGTQV